jgi:3,4-dihydroxy 2-butanone 4-phosphate synthase / GTP cyclohydrolase II
MPIASLKVDPIEQVVAAFSRGEMVVIADDVDRENEGDLAFASSTVTPEKIAFMANEARGLICVSVSSEIAQALDLPFQVSNNNSPFHTPFTLSIDHKSVGSDGITAVSRCQTIKQLLEPTSRAEDFISPGHVFPLIANVSGVFGRQGQTEASYDLARICGLGSSGVICEILNPDGQMARGAELNNFAKQHGLLVTTVAEIIKYRLQRDTLARKTATAELITDYGTCIASVYEDQVERKEHLLLVYGDIDSNKDSSVLVRIHSECVTGDVFGSRRCDCGSQLELSLKKINLRQEGRGIGLLNKLRAYELQDDGADTVEANVRLGFKPDQRDFAVAANILHANDIHKIRLITNNPEKIATMKRFGLEVVERVPVISVEDQYSKSYLETKRSKMGHMI